ncbi:hypothetical protein ACSQ76_12355 [Roseovarius sp. B08]|uniref:hypothetical protein n=1 Tax=Roseovarius sp. B08 TaxID=3449223 RepID=UPI003EDB8DA1
MTGQAAYLVEAEAIEEYPIASAERLESHFYMEWHFRRWRKSRFRQLVDPECGWYGFLLFNEAQDETPVGTLPVDDRLLAKALGLSLEAWQSLLKREITPLHGWHKVRTDTGEIRLAHPVVTEMALKALAGKRRNSEERERRRAAKRLKDLAAMIERVGASQLLRRAGLVEAVDQWLMDNAQGRNRTEALVREALDAVCGG